MDTFWNSVTKTPLGHRNGQKKCIEKVPLKIVCIPNQCQG